MSDLWKVFILRAGVRSFLKVCLPILMTYLVCSNFQDISIESLDGETGKEFIRYIYIYIYKHLLIFSIINLRGGSSSQLGEFNASHVKLEG